jgi:hypothetical protein
VATSPKRNEATKLPRKVERERQKAAREKRESFLLYAAVRCRKRKSCLLATLQRKQKNKNRRWRRKGIKNAAI